MDGLERFVDAQEHTYADALAELRRGQKRGHWMWFVFPQVAGLGFSAMAQTYAIGSLAEARAYLAHPVLGPRLLECSRAVLDAPGSSAEQVIRDATDLTASVAPWLQADHEGLTGKVLKLPERSEIDTPVQEQLIVELYSK